MFIIVLIIQCIENKGNSEIIKTTFLSRISYILFFFLYIYK
jgi:hypothetical protein